MKQFAAFLGLVMAIVCVIVFAGLVQQIDGSLDARRLEAQARQAEAEKERLALALDLAQAQAQIETARGERAVLEAAARSVDSDRRLVEWYTLRGDLRGALAFVGALGLAICGGALYVALKGVKNGNKNE